jgi:hypothetical protein
LIKEIPRSIPDIHDFSNRWQFIVDLEVCYWGIKLICFQSICVGEDHLKLYNSLVRLAKRFLVDGVEDPSLRQELFDLLCLRYDLCDEFHRLYVSGQNLSDQERAKIETELRYEDQNTTKHYFVNSSVLEPIQQYGQIGQSGVGTSGQAASENRIAAESGPGQNANSGWREPERQILQAPILRRDNSHHSEGGSEVYSGQRGVSNQRVEQWAQSVGDQNANNNISNQQNLLGPQRPGVRAPSQLSDWDELSASTASLNLGTRQNPRDRD